MVVAEETVPEKILFNEHIRPILSENCFMCHGPDAAARKGKLRLDERASALSREAIVPGKPDLSEAMYRVLSSDPDDVMPPPESKMELTEIQKEILRKWIAEGAEYEDHWAYVKPARPEPPPVKQSAWPRNAIDGFLLAHLEEKGLKPSPEADRPTLIRRASLDLTGLPPTIEAVNRFLKDKDEGAYERMVDGLLASTAYGERWARVWLDLARYADSAGYADDPPRTIWAYRDWVIQAINRNLPFDEFTLQQLAGDLLENPSEEQLVATAFHRNTLTNNEGGTNDEEFRNVAVVDRVNTTMAVWMGTTMSCAQCHDHKYDPISQEEYF
ncbi:MAG: DUF1549 domain-containing protein, partial [Verrucomicrobiota bacterium]